MCRRSSLSGNPYGRQSSGFTLVELIVSIVLLGILAAVGSSMIVDSLTTTRMVNASNASAAQARYALERLEREVREIKYTKVGASANYSISIMTATKLAFVRIISGADVTVTIDNSTTPTVLTLSYSSPEVTTTLSTNSTIALAYYDIAGNATVSTSAIRFVEVTLTVTDPTSGQSMSQRSRVALRNA